MGALFYSCLYTKSRKSLLSCAARICFCFITRTGPTLIRNDSVFNRCLCAAEPLASKKHLYAKLSLTCYANCTRKQLVVALPKFDRAMLCSGIK